ncbi:phosphopantetheine-binding protein [Micromonospora sp. NPDC005413]|uniref:phosphopantetheine-binding protein n=1 Tax=Micromonospora sp. NPDC005413 TaxID=3154563 RepID=UPI00339F6729
MDDASFFQSIIGLLGEINDDASAVAALNDPVTGPEINLFDAGLLRSLTVVRLLRAMEEYFNVQVPVEQYGMEAFFTLRSIRRMMEPLLVAEGRVGVT